MRLRGYQWAELFGVVLLLASTAIQVFYVEPLKREIEWRLAAFNMQQNGQLQVKAIYASQIATLRAVKAAGSDLKAAESERDELLGRYRTADANISDYLIAKEQVENWLQMLAVALFALGSLLAGFGRAMEMKAAGHPQ